MKLYLETDEGQRVEIHKIENITVSTKKSQTHLCEYCKTGLGNRIFTTNDEDGKEWDLELMLDSWNNDNVISIESNNNWGYDYVEFRIKYCPFCGREL